MKILISGIGGRMGAEVKKMVLDGYRGATLCSGYDVAPIEAECPTYTSWSDVKETPDCIIDFSHHAGTKALLKYACEKNIPVVLATTGHDETEKGYISEAAKKIPLFHSANMSLGVALLVELAKTAALAMPEADIEIIEKHHTRKLDAPSGTAITLAEGILENLDRKVRWVPGTLLAADGTLTGTTECAADELPVSSIREGEVPGIHSIRYDSEADSITITHDAKSRRGFALGAVLAAEYTAEHQGLLGMNDLFDF